MSDTISKLGSAREVLRFARWRQWRQLVAASLLSIANQTGEVLTPIVVGVVIDRAVVTGDGAALLRWSVVLVALYLAQSLSYRYGQRRTHYGAVLVEQDLRLAVLARIVAPVGGAERGRLPGDLVSVNTVDVWSIAFVNYLVPLTAAALVGVVVGGAVVTTYSVPVGIVVLAGAPPVLALVHLLGRPLQVRNQAQQEGAADAAGVAVDLVRGVRVIKGIGAERSAQVRYRDVSRRSFDAALALARADAAYQGVVILLNGLFLVAVGYVGLAQASQGSLTFGQLVAVIGVAQFLLGPMATIAEFSAASAAARASAGRVADVLAAPAAVAPGTVAPTVGAGGLSFHDVAVGPLTSLNLAVAPGEVLGVVAADPAAAAAFVRCLSRELDPEHGTVKLDGVSLTELAPDDARVQMLATVHDTALFDESVHAALVSLGAGPETVDRAIAAAQLGDVLQARPGDGGTSVSERGRSLSGGERQRVALARSLTSSAPVLVLHEPTSAVDSVTERRIAQAAVDLRRGRTTVLVTTSPALLQVTDRVVMLADDGVAAEGTHGHLLATAPAYRELVLA